MGYMFFKFMSEIQLHAQNKDANNELLMFMPDSSNAIHSLKNLVENFPPKSAIRDNYDMFGATFAYFIMEDVSDKENVLRNYPLLVANDLNQRIMALRVR
jgi:hypothetical protein